MGSARTSRNAVTMASVSSSVGLSIPATCSVTFRVITPAARCT
ncbi:Uncharacterised protein [Mycobacteroides abscessus subsp. abscessus]|nr:Uncharacterised protein [Mycobacteroides abscessus subsp. abscessus]